MLDLPATQTSAPSPARPAGDRMRMMRREHRRYMWRAFSQSFPSPAALLRSVNGLLGAGAAFEKQRRWDEVLEVYGRLNVLFEVARARPDLHVLFSANPMLEFEFFAAYGWALQKRGRHRMAVHYYSRALDSVFVPKSGCTVRCLRNSCLMAPLYGHRAVSYGKIGELRRALSDAEMHVQLDRFNADAYCGRALVRSARNEHQKALEDLRTALALRPQHRAALLLQECIRRRMEGSRAPPAVADCPVVLFIADFSVSSEELAAFIDRLLPTFHIPRTVRQLVLRPDPGAEEAGDAERPRSAAVSSVPEAARQRLTPTFAPQSRRGTRRAAGLRRNYNRPWTGDATPFVPRREIVHQSPFYV